MSKDNIDLTVTVIGAPEPQVPSLARMTRDRIRELIQQFLKKDEMELLHEAARDLEILPLSTADDERWYGIRPDGDLMSFNSKRPYDPKEEDDLWTHATTLSRSLEEYPELEPLVPPPPLSCRTCPRCGGRGVIIHADGEINCICEGVGWMPSMEDPIAKRSEKQEQ